MTPAIFIPCSHNGFRFLPRFAGLNLMSDGETFFCWQKSNPAPKLLCFMMMLLTANFGL